MIDKPVDLLLNFILGEEGFTEAKDIETIKKIRLLFKQQIERAYNAGYDDTDYPGIHSEAYYVKNYCESLQDIVNTGVNIADIVKEGAILYWIKYDINATTLHKVCVIHIYNDEHILRVTCKLAEGHILHTNVPLTDLYLTNV